MSAFTALVFAKGFERVSVREIVDSSAVARSTFYEHFSCKEDVLRACMSRFFGVIAECVCEENVPLHLDQVLGHLWENRRLTDAIFSGAPRKVLAQSLSEMVEPRLHDVHQGAPLTLPYRLAAIHIAEAQLALIETWLRGRAFARKENIGLALHRSSRAVALTLIAAA